MASFRGVRSLVLFRTVLYLLFLEYLYAQETGNSKCDQPCFISVDRELTVSWTGDDRDGTVELKMTTKDTNGRKCDSNLSLTAKFNERKLTPNSICSNALYYLAISVTCGGITTHRQNMTARTPPDAPPIIEMKPTNVSINVKWSPPPGSIVSYRVVLSGGRKQKEGFRQITNGTSYNFKGLEPYTMYEAYVMAKNEDYWSEAGVVKSIRTLEGVPFEPENLKATEVSTEHIALMWDDPEPETGLILRFEIVWTENGTQESSKEVSKNKSYIIKNLFPYTEYTIEVAAVNAIGKGAPSIITVVTELAAPDPPNLHILEVTNHSISVTWKLSDFYRGPEPVYHLRWKKEGGIDSYSSTDIQGASREEKYTISKVKPFTQYEVQIRAGNRAGNGRWSDVQKTKTLVGIPSIPRNLQVHSKSATHVTVSWNEPVPANGAIMLYIIHWSAKLHPSKTDHVNVTSYIADDLFPYTDYDFKVQAATDAGWSEWSSLLKVRTDVSVPSEPLNLTEDGVTSSTISIQWLPPKHKNGPRLDYVIRWAKAGGDNEDYDYYGDFSNLTYSSDYWENDEINETSYEIINLDSYTNYSVEVGAKTSAGPGNYTKPLVIQTAAGIPTSPTSVKAVQVHSTTLTVKWSAPNIMNGPLKYYLVHWGVDGTDGSRVITSASSYTALGLRPYTKYFFKIAAETEGGLGPFTTIYKRTDISTPSVPTNLLCISVTDHCVLLKWAPPEHPNDVTLRYMVEWSGTSSESSTVETGDTTFRIRDLASETNYSIRVCGVTTVGQGPWTNAIYAFTDQKDHSSAIIAGSVVGILIVLIIIATLVVLFMAKKKGGLKYLIPSRSTAKDSSESVKPTDVSIALEDLHETEKIDVRNFDEHVLKLMSNGYYKLAQEFEKLGKESPALPTNEAKKNDNLTKNRWVKILPFDHSRVKLRPVGDEVEPDFINASYIPGDSYLLEYIATQGPLPSTLNEFWRMVWQESVFLVVMLTQCVERAKRTCERYWPSAGATHKYGELEVHTVSESITPAYIQRLLLVSQGNKQRHIVHLHYMNWPVSGCPKSPDDFLSFVRTVRSQMSCGVTGPMLIHCSAGIGRTGTFIAVDRLSQQLNRQSDEIDIYGTVLEMRKHRANLVQTEEQYYFIHLCVQRTIQEKRQELENDYGGGIYSN